jgi:hypothetical protein
VLRKLLAGSQADQRAGRVLIFVGLFDVPKSRVAWALGVKPPVVTQDLKKIQKLLHREAVIAVVPAGLARFATQISLLSLDCAKAIEVFGQQMRLGIVARGLAALCEQIAYSAPTIAAMVEEFCRWLAGNPRPDGAAAAKTAS